MTDDQKARAQLSLITACGCVWVILIGIGFAVIVGAFFGAVGWAAVAVFNLLSGGGA